MTTPANIRPADAAPAASRQILALNAFDAARPSNLPPETAALVARRQRSFGPTSVLFYDRPLHVVSGDGVWLQEADGTRYLDVCTVCGRTIQVPREMAEQAVADGQLR